MKLDPISADKTVQINNIDLHLIISKKRILMIGIILNM